MVESSFNGMTWTIGAALNGTRSAVVDSNLADAGEQPYDAAAP